MSSKKIVSSSERSKNNTGLESEIAKEQELLAEQEIKIAKLKKKMIIFGIILLVLITAYIALAIYNKSIV